MEINLEEKKVYILKRHPKAIVHMKSQFPEKFGIVFGAGLSQSFNIPTWQELVQYISKDENILAENLPRESSDTTLPFQTQMLFEHFRKKRYGTEDHIIMRNRELDYTILAEWLEIIRSNLYKNKHPDFEKALSDHPYLEKYIPIIKQTNITVNYNFDDLLEKALFITHRNEKKLNDNHDDEKEWSKGYESVTNASLQFRSTNSIIYHPNGSIPEKQMETPSDRFIFSEHEFADQLLDMLAGDFSTLLNHFSKNTCLFIGLSLDDQTLRSLLRQTARSNPGHYHYYIKYLSNSDELTEESKNAIKLANFKVYNLITLFLDDGEIAALGELISISDQKFCEFAQINGVKIKYPYYLTGPLGVGKSTAISYFRNLITYDEWLEPRPDLLSTPWKELTEIEKEDTDNWIASQFKLKNDNLRYKKFGLFVLDRAPLDPLAFTKTDEWTRKAKNLLDAICPGHSGWKVEPGCVILLTGDHDELALRLKLTKRTGYKSELLVEMEETLKKAYDHECIKVIDTKNLSPSEVAQRIAEIIHLSDYEFVDLHDRLEKIRDNAELKCELKK